jgi:hypothetical protein
MEAKRLLSRVAKLIDRMSDKIETRADLPEKGLLSEVGGLLERYTALMRAINEQSGSGEAQTSEDILKNGIKGAYDKLLFD